MSHFKISTQYRVKLLAPRWQQKRLSILSRDKFTCQVCNSTDKTLHVHHIHYWPESVEPWDYTNASLLTVCHDCHASEHEGWHLRSAYLFEGGAIAGFRTNQEFLELADMLVTLGHAVAQPEVEAELFELIKAHLAKVRARSAQ